MYSFKLRGRLENLLCDTVNTFKSDLETGAEFIRAVRNLEYKYAQNDEKRMDSELEDEVLIRFANKSSTWNASRSDTGNASGSDTWNASGSDSDTYDMPSAPPILVKYKSGRVNYNELFKRGVALNSVNPLFMMRYLPERVMTTLSDKSIINLNSLRNGDLRQAREA
jgi:hypothetical protein